MSTRVHVGIEMEDHTASGDAVSHRNCAQVFGDKVRRFPGLLWHSTCKFGGFLKNYLERFDQRVWKFLGSWWHTIWKVGEEDYRRVIHALKVGVALTLVSQLYLIDPLHKRFDDSGIWAVMTVVVVLEFNAGATFYKGLNRGLGTFSAGFLGCFIEYISDASGHIFRAVFISVAVCLVGAGATYMRFVPSIKKNYDYGVVIFLLTFNLITLSSYRVDNVLNIAKERFYTIGIGCGICLCMTLLIFPIWSGQDLHNSTLTKLEGLAKSIEACVKEYFNDNDTEGVGQEIDDIIYQGYRVVLDSKSNDETLAVYASWEPRHAKHKIPCNQYLKLGTVLRQFGYTVVALHGCLQTEIQTPKSVRALFKDPCIRLACEVSKALTELASSVKNHRHCSPEILSDHLHEAIEDLNTAIKSQPRLFLGADENHAGNMLALAAAHATQKQQKEKEAKISLSSVKTDSSALLEWKTKSKTDPSTLLEWRAKRAPEADRKTLRPQLSKIAIMSLEFSEALPFAAFASLLLEIVARLDGVIEEVEELGRVAGFKEFNHGDDQIIVTCERPSERDNHLPSHAAE
ncbi:aluminum-activated malate transporter 12-like [Pistacia vera]|uniref:aluminum-activated malate transporter 12-like n=1 Tax=Pistacia vera TaxID=55513 RepID=UPI001263294B|nr:aluminum-activated malate transporter 12-like [Pistacia vera]